jgi:D-sedoheptulose 7-phosphate isomerase
MGVDMNELLELIREAIKHRNYIFICGNGGSAATAEHFTNDLFSVGARAVCLNSNTAIITMIANDFNYKYIYSKQLERLAEPGDLLITLSVSGTSPNIVEVTNTAGKMGVKSYWMGGNIKDFGLSEDKNLQWCHEIKKEIQNDSSRSTNSKA